jgi:hypothetical protein
VLVNVSAPVRLPAGKRPKALVLTDERVSRWRVATERLTTSEASGEVLKQLEKAAQPPSSVKVWTPAQLGRFLVQAEVDRLYALYHRVAHCGLLRGKRAGCAGLTSTWTRPRSP